MKRSTLQKVLLVYAIFNLCLMLTACGDWESQAVQIIGLLGPAVQALIAILMAFGIGIAPSVLAKFKEWSLQTQTAILTLKGLIMAYKDAAASAQPGILSEIQTGLKVIEDSLATILPELHITNADTQAKIVAGFDAVAAFVAAIIALLPAVKPTLTDHEAKALHSKAKTTADGFKQRFNAAVSYFGKQYRLD